MREINHNSSECKAVEFSKTDQESLTHMNPSERHIKTYFSKKERAKMKKSLQK
jgi:hypothetical protein